MFSVFTPNANASTEFTDVHSSYNFYDEVMYLYDRGIISGYGNGEFKPNAVVTRDAAAAMIGRALKLDGTQRNTTFSDVGASNYASGFIDSAVKQGIISGYADGTYRPKEPVTRGQMAIFLARAFKLSNEANVYFSDVSPSITAYSSIKKILAFGITTGYADNTFRPNKQLSRGDFSAFLARALNDSFKVEPPASSGKLAVHFLDVDQGDSSLLITPNGKTILIDGGKQTAGEKVVSYLKAAGVTSIDYLVATHPDADHIGGLIPVLNQIPVKNVIDSGKSHTSQTYMDYLTLIDQKNIPFHVAQTGEFIDVDPAIKVQVLNSGDGSSDNNEASVVLKVTHGSKSYLFTGDAGIQAEADMVSSFDVNADVLKVSHHGSETGSSQLFLNEVTPTWAVLSFGEGNSYGHPDSVVVNRLTAMGATVVPTTNGDIAFESNGSSIQLIKGVPGTEPQPTPNTGKIDITNLDLSQEIVTLKNIDTSDVPMDGWTLISVDGNQQYEFPSDFVLKKGASVTVTTGRSAYESRPTHLLWTTAYTWDNNGDAARLVDPQGTIIDELAR
ncbi:S-layer homology domain-containing protein [Bacillus sp. ISL-45]|uniref:S-layer homology domain-containing protein n=1 Tax=Bacillus sp. ISL-45 TaxID=2819128 RepID=UPI001BE8CB29|nr:S-layer homology domain-containing protein [Bacillus sp. ISL-45]